MRKNALHYMIYAGQNEAARVFSPPRRAFMPRPSRLRQAPSTAPAGHKPYPEPLPQAGFRAFQAAPNPPTRQTQMLPSSNHPEPAGPVASGILLQRKIIINQTLKKI
jgi:hypothetical protein